MEIEPTHTSMAQDEDVTSNADEDGVSDDSSGTDDDSSSDDDFEFKDLEKEIYGRLGGPPPELNKAIGKVVVTDHNENKISNNKEKKQTITSSKAAEKSKRTPLQEITSKSNEKVAECTTTKPKVEKVTPPVIALVNPIPAMESPKIESTVTKNVSTNPTPDQVTQTSTERVDSTIQKGGKNKDPMGDCGCIVM